MTIFVRTTAAEPLCVLIVYQCDTLVTNTNMLYFGDGQAHSCIWPYSSLDCVWVIKSMSAHSEGAQSIGEVVQYCQM